MKQGQFEEAIEVVHHGSILMNQHKQHSSATDLGLLLIEAYNESATPVSQKAKGGNTHSNIEKVRLEAPF